MRRSNKSAFCALFALVSMLSTMLRGQEAAGTKAPGVAEDRKDLRLAVVIVIDQLRGDALQRFGPALGRDGLLRLALEGVWYREAVYSHAHTVTGVGHATVGTGARPSSHGIVANEWIDRASGARLNCVGDASQPIVGTAGETGNASPANLLATTFADELIFASAGKSRAFGVSGKDRAAILPVGKTGKAFWYSTQSGRMVSSKYFYKDLPAWVVDWDKKSPSDRFFKSSWKRCTSDNDGTPSVPDDRSFEGEIHGNGKKFPHPLGNGMDKPEAKLYDQVRASPFGDEVTMDFAIELLRQEKLGKGDAVDVLSISLSSNDAVGHTWGPDSIEAKEVLFGVDRQIARLIATLDAEVGAGRWLLALTADHGIGYPPSGVSALGFPANKYDTGEVLKKINRRLNFSIRYLDWSVGFAGAGYYFDPDALRFGGKTPAELESIAAEVIRESTGVAEVFTRSDILAGQLPDNEVSRRVSSAYHPARSPDVYMMADTFWIGGGVASHGEPYLYDLHVPILFYGAGLPPTEVFRPIDVRDIAATFSAVLGTAMPSACTGVPLPEVIGGVKARVQPPRGLSNPPPAASPSRRI